MQAWGPQSGLCVFCAFDRHALRSFPAHSSARKLISTFSAVRLEGSKGRRRPIRKDGGFSYRDKPDSRSSKLGRDSSSSFRSRLLKRDPSLIRKTIIDIMNAMKSRLKTGRFENEGTLKQCSILDPDGQYFASFMPRVLATFEPGAKTKLRDEQPLDNATVEECRKAFVDHVHGGIVVALTDAYVDHIIKKSNFVDEGTMNRLSEDTRYPTEWFPYARTLQRQIHLHVGPTNSGKTYTALKRLETAGKGFYAGPLRLLAHEVYSRLNARGFRCGLVTGDEVKGMEVQPPLSAHTVEMAPLGMLVDVAVIDEIQMLGNEDRGWAWTQALLGVQAKELHLCGEERVVPLVQELTASMGDTLHIHKYERLNPLKTMSKSIRGDLKRLQKGDCIVCFSILNLHAMKKDIEEATGRNCAIVYGSLPPEIRAQQARLFNDPDNTYDYLVASDAIGMGLNLSIKRIIFDSVVKFNGRNMEFLDVPSLKQIAGRAGRYRTAHNDTSQIKSESETKPSQPTTAQSIGLVTTMLEQDLSYVQRSMSKIPEPLAAAGLQPPAQIIARYSALFPPATPFSYLIRRIRNTFSTHPRYFQCHMRNAAEIAKIIDGIDGLSVMDKYTFTACPAFVRDPLSAEIVKELAMCIGNQKKGHLLDIVKMPLEYLDRPVQGKKQHLIDLEVLHRGLTLYIWLAFRFGDIFESRLLAEHAKQICEGLMDQILVKLSVDPQVREELHRREVRSRKHFARKEADVEAKKDDVQHMIPPSDTPPAIPADWAGGSENAHDAFMAHHPTVSESGARSVQ